MNIAGLEEELKKCYGQEEGMRVYRTIIPGILGDFAKVIRQAPPGSIAREEYRLEDGRGIIYMTAKKDRANPEIEAAFILL